MRVTVGEATSHIGSGATPRGGQSVYRKDGVVFIRSQNVRDGRLNLGDAAYIAAEVHSTMRRSSVLPADVLLNITGASIGRSCVVPEDIGQANVNQHVCILRSNGRVLPGYLQTVLDTPEMQQSIRDLAAGGSREGLNYQQISSLAIPLLSLARQAQVVSIRARADAVLNAVDATLTALVKRRCVLRAELVTGRRGFSAFADMPHWELVALGEIADGVTRRNGDIGSDLVLTCSGQHGLIDQREFFSKSVASESREGYFLLERGEFSYNRSSMNGYPYGAIKRLDRYASGALSTLNICFALKGEKCDSDFLLHVFESGVLNQQLGRIARVGSRAHGLLNVTRADFFGLSFTMPSIDEQRKIAQFLNALDREIVQLTQLRDAYDEQKCGVMRRLLSSDMTIPGSLVPSELMHA